MNDHPVIVLREEDRACPTPDLQGTLIELSEKAGRLLEDAEDLRDLLTRYVADPSGACSRAQPRMIEIHEQAGRVRDLVERVSQGYRASGALSVAYTGAPGVR